MRTAFRKRRKSYRPNPNINAGLVTADNSHQLVKSQLCPRASTNSRQNFLGQYLSNIYGLSADFNNCSSRKAMSCSVKKSLGNKNCHDKSCVPYSAISCALVMPPHRGFNSQSKQNCILTPGLLPGTKLSSSPGNIHKGKFSRK